MDQKSVLSTRFGGGPHGYGDPDDKTLRKVEEGVIVPQLMRKKAREEKCTELVQAFSKCGKENGVRMVYKCRKENDLMQECYRKWYNDPEFKEQCRQEYLTERSEFRRTGMGKKYRDLMAEGGR